MIRTLAAARRRRDPRRSPRSRPGWPFLFYLLYLGDPRHRRLVRPGPPRPGRPRGRLRGQPAPRPRRRPDAGHLHAAQHQPDPEAVARDPQPDDAARRPARPGDHRSAARTERSWLIRAPLTAPRPLPDRAAAHPDRRPVRLLRGVGDGRAGGHGRRLPAARAAARAGACRRRPSRAATRSPERTLQTTPLATTVRPYAPGRRMNRIHWKTTARHGEIQVKEFDLEQTADAWIILDLAARRPDRARRRVDGRGARPGGGVDRRQGAPARTARSGMTVNVGRTAFLPADRGGRQHLKIMQLLAAVEADGSAPLVETLIATVGAAAPGDDRGHHHRLARPVLGPAARRRCARAASPASS